MKKSDLRNIIKEEIVSVLKELDNNVDAVFLGWQKGFGSHKSFPLYNVIKKGHERYGSTISANELDKLHLKYLPPPPEETSKMLEIINSNLDAEFLGWQSFPKINKSVALYNVTKQGPLRGSTVSVPTLEKNHLRFEPPPPLEQWLKDNPQEGK